MGFAWRKAVKVPRTEKMTPKQHQKIVIKARPLAFLFYILWGLETSRQEGLGIVPTPLNPICWGLGSGDVSSRLVGFLVEDI